MSITVLVSVRALPSVACWYSAFLALSAMPREAATDWVVRMGGGGAEAEDRGNDNDGDDDDEICSGGVNDGIGGEEEDDDDCGGGDDEEGGEEEEGIVVAGSERVETRGVASAVDTEIGRLVSDISLFLRTFPRTFSGTFSRTFPDSGSVFLALDSLSFTIFTSFTSLSSSTSIPTSLRGREAVDVIGRGEVEEGGAD
jgi:hypothetical protein